MTELETLLNKLATTTDPKDRQRLAEEIALLLYP